MGRRHLQRIPVLAASAVLAFVASIVAGSTAKALTKLDEEWNPDLK